MSSNLPPYAMSGWATVGIGGSQGSFNVPSGGSVSATIMDALVNSAGVVLLPGIWQLDQPITMPGAGRSLMIGPGAVVRNVTSGATGLASITGERCSIIGAGGKIEVATWVNSQKLISVASGGNWFETDGLYIDVTTTGGNNSTPMILFSVASVVEPMIRRAKVLPNTGVRVFGITSVDGGGIYGCKIRDAGGTAIASAPATPRNCYQVGKIVTTQQFDIKDNTCYGLGTLTTAELDSVWLVQNSGPDTAERAISFEGNRINYCVSPSALNLEGVVIYLVQNNHFGSAGGAVAAAGEATIILNSAGDADQTASEALINGSSNITDNHFDFSATAAGNCIYSKRAKKVDIIDNHFHVSANGPTSTILLEIPQTRHVRVDGNRFDGTVGTSEWGVKLNDTAAAGLGVLTPIGISIGRGNVGSGLLFGVAPGREPAAAWGSGFVYDDGSPFFNINVSAAGRQPVLDSTGVALGGVVTVLPSTTSATLLTSGGASYAAAIIAQKLNRLVNGLGNFQTNLTGTGTTEGAATDGTIAAVSTQNTFRDAIREITTKINELIDLPKTIAGKIKAQLTIVNGSGTAGAVAKLTDNSGGTASLTGVLAAITTYGAAGDGAHAIATLAQAVNSAIDYISCTSNTGVMTSVG